MKEHQKQNLVQQFIRHAHKHSIRYSVETARGWGADSNFGTNSFAAFRSKRAQRARKRPITERFKLLDWSEKNPFCRRFSHDCPWLIPCTLDTVHWTLCMLCATFVKENRRFGLSMRVKLTTSRLLILWRRRWTISDGVTWRQETDFEKVYIRVSQIPLFSHSWWFHWIAWRILTANNFYRHWREFSARTLKTLCVLVDAKPGRANY